MAIQNIRKQHAVGQGFFHTGELLEGNSHRLRYVVDCGAMNKYASQLNSRIDDYLAAVGAKQPLDLLFISHVHADHVSGLERLLDGVRGLVVKTIVMPLLNVEDRLVAFARAASEDAISADSAFYKAFVVNPTAAVARFNPERVIFVEPDGPDGGAPYNGGPDDRGNGPGNSVELLRGDRELPWKLAGSGLIRLDRKGSADLKGGAAAVMPESLGIECASAGTGRAWLFAPYVDPAVKAGTTQFMKSLAEARGASVAALKRWLRATSNVEQLVTADISDLKAAYAAIHVDLNVTSMCLYSGPVPAPSQLIQGYIARFGKWTVRQPNAYRAAWLGTGDAALANRSRRRAFFKHYGSLLQEVVTMTLPHHGSEHNFDAELLSRIQPDFCIAPADRFSNWRHPGTSVVQSVASTGRFLSVVASDINSEVVETVLVG